MCGLGVSIRHHTHVGASAPVVAKLSATDASRTEDGNGRPAVGPPDAPGLIGGIAVFGADRY